MSIQAYLQQEKLPVLVYTVCWRSLYVLTCSNVTHNMIQMNVFVVKDESNGDGDDYVYELFD
jgi:hypothetical protein